VSHLKRLNQEELAFASSAGLSNGVYMLEAYLGPLLAALAPGVWGFAVFRTSGPLVSLPPGEATGAMLTVERLEPRQDVHSRPCAEGAVRARSHNSRWSS
jgi:hypothetical protein